MKCGQAEKWMDALLDERSGGASSGAPGSPAQPQREFEAHLAACPACRGQWEALRSAEAVLRVPKPVPAPESLLADFRRRLAEEEQRSAPLAPPVPRRPVWRWVWPLGSLAAAGVAAAAVLMFNLQPPLSSIQEVRGWRETPHAVETPGRPAFETQRGPGTDGAAAARSKVLPAPSGFVGVPVPKPEPRVAGRPRGEKPLSGKPSLSAAGPNTTWNMPNSAAGSFGSTTRSKQASPEANVLGLKPAAPHAPQPLQDFALAEREGSRPASPTPLDVTPGKPSQSEARLEDGDRASKNLRSQGDVVASPQKQVTANAGLSTAQGAPVKSQSLNYLYSSNAAQLTQQAAQNGNIYYAQVPVEPTPVELNVSAAVLNALQRPVELRSANVQVQALAEQLATEADVELKVDPKIAQMSVSVNEAGVPLWRVLEDVARQTQTEIYPRENSLVLRPPAPAEAGVERGRNEPKLDAAAKTRADSLARNRGLQQAPKVVTEAVPPPAAPAAPAGAAGSRGPAGLAGPRGPAGAPSGGFGGGAGMGGFGRGFRIAPEAETKPRPEGSARYAFSSRQPDRKVWPAAWGNLPERGFEVPTADELPPLVLAPVQVGTTLSNEVPQVRTRVERLSRKRSEAGEKAAAAKAKKKSVPAKVRKRVK